MKDFITYLDSFIVFWNPLFDIIVSLFVLFWTVLVRHILKIFVFQKLNWLAEKTKTKVDDIFLLSVDRFVNVWFWFLAFYLAKFFIYIPNWFDDLVDKILTIALIAIFFYLFKNLVWDLIDYYFSKTSKKAEKYFSALVRNISNIIIWWIWITILLSELWYDISTLVAWLWISWLAVALAIQPILASIFASFFIFMDKPFKVWDFISVWSYTWTVKEIWLYSTRIITLKKTEAVISNTELMNSQVENISQRKSFRADIALWIVYETPSKKLKKAMDIVRDILEKHEKVADDIWIYFKEFWDFSLNIDATYFIKENDYNEILWIISEINLDIKERLEKEGIELAYPTSVNYIKK